MRHLRLLPPGHRHGWTPYAWLIYLASFFIEPVIRTQHGNASAPYWAATIAGVVVFLVVYFRAYWMRGMALLRYATAMVLLGIGFAPFNTGAPVFFVYGAAIIANLDRQRDAFLSVVAIAVIGGAAAFLTTAPIFSFLVATVITLLVGGVNVHFAEQARAQAKLRMAHDQIEHLAAVAERERIARDLHDVLGHTLSLIVLKSELAHRLATRDPARAAAEMKDVEEVARRTLQEVRETIRGYHASLADERGRAEAMLGAAEIDSRFDLGDAPLPQVVEETLALALREAVTNVVRHSGARHCHVALERRPGVVALVIIDNGRGMSAREGSGLRGMRDRVEAFGGSVELSAAQPRGVQLRIALPVGHAHARLEDDVALNPLGAQQSAG
jgi:two-component system, NarL family, sensor histidine kinase DesK